MGKKFDKIFESVVGRNQVGGYLTGDWIQFRPDYKNSLTYKAMPSVMRDELDELVSGGLNIKVIQVGDKLSGVSGGNQHKTSDNVVVTVGGDTGGGRITNSFTVSTDMIDIADKDTFSPDVPDQFELKHEVDYKPKVFKPDDKHITRQTNKNSGVGGKNTPAEYKMAGESTRKKFDNDNMAMLYEDLWTPEEETQTK